MSILVNYKDTAPLQLTDITGEYLPRENILLAQGKGNDFIRIDKDEAPTRRFDGKTSKYRLLHLSLSCECEKPTDEAWCMVSSSEIQWWTPTELAAIGIHVRRTKQGMFDNNYDIFDHVSIL
jgi:hypothetical protein